MKTSAIQQARARLARAREALAVLESAQAFSVLEDSWSQFLVAADLVFSKLGAGAKGCSLSEPWFGRKLHEQKQDELLQFLYLARNSEEHGIERSLENAYRVDIRPGVVLHLDATFEANGDVVFRRQDDPKVIVPMPLTGAAKAVADRSGRMYGPPVTHRGQQVQPTVLEIGRLALRYLEGLVLEAEKLPQRT
jgi:hypothetical protein